jgi:hypothetical protein
MPSSSSSPRIGALVSLVGVALVLLGFFLPMFTGSNPQVPGSSHPVYEWEFVPLSSGFPLFALFAVLAALPLLGMLIILATSVATLFGVSLPRLLWLKRAAAAWGLAAQLLFDAFVLLIVGDLIGLRPGSFVVALLGLVMGVFVVEAYQKQKRRGGDIIAS